MPHLLSGYRGLAVLSLCLAVLAAAGCANHVGSTRLGDLPAHYEGTLPCADCTGIDYSLLLSTDRVYVLREHYDTHPAVGDFIETGRWRVHDHGNQLELTPADTDSYLARLWRIDAGQRLTALNDNGQPIDSGLNFSITRTAASKPRDLAGPRWMLIDAPDRPGASPAYIHFDHDTSRVTGSTGCNRLMARYQRNDNRLRIQQTATTRRACPHQADTEQALSEALRRTQRFETLGDFLLLYGANNDPSPLAVFRAAT